ncbi:MAG: hypothetical protein SF182_28100 [Deltaproteobacteria bacterium]|nr:hypothetical protein [Deltaproteobacteria bacterium]
MRERAKRRWRLGWWAVLCLTIASPVTVGRAAAVTNSVAPVILFVTQPPFGGDFASTNAVFGNHDPYVGSTPRGGDLYIRYADGTLRNLTAAAGYGLTAAQAIAVREPCVHWDGSKALFSMVVGGTTQNDYRPVYWQIYEVSGFGAGETVRITKLPQPADSNNVSPIYGTDDRILFTSDRPRNGDRLTYPQLDEYESTPTVTGIWSMRADGTDLFLLDHAVSGAFTPLVASDGRVVYTRWDHLQRDQQSNEGTLDYGAFNYVSEASAQTTTSTTEIFPELRRRASGSPIHGHTFNVFFPWQINEDGSGLETLNHVGRHELSRYFDAARDGLPEFIAPQSRRDAELILQMEEDPLRPGYFYATTAPEFSTHAAGQIIGFDAPEGLNADDFVVDYITAPETADYTPDGGTPPANFPGHFRNPVPLTDGTLLAVRSASPYADRAENGVLSSRYDFHLTRLQSAGAYWTAGARLIPGGISKSILYWDNQVYRQVSYSGPLWELDPTEVRARPRPARHANPLPETEAQILRDELGGAAGIERLRAFLAARDLALIVSRNVTRRADRQQDFNLKVVNGVQTALPGATPVPIEFMQLLQGDLIRGYSQFHAGRRVLAQLMHDGLNPPLNGAPASSVRLGTDGSMAAFVPAHRAMTWQLVGSDGTPVVRERYWVTFAAGEMRMCTNCHGVNTTDTVLQQPPPTNPPQALRDLARWWAANYDDGSTPLPSPTGAATATPPATATRTATPIPATATNSPTRTRTRTPLPTVTAAAPIAPQLDALTTPLVVGASNSLSGSGFTPGSRVMLFVATSGGTASYGPYVPTARTATTLTWLLPASMPLGNGFATVVVVNTDQGYLQSNPQSQMLRGAAAANIPTILSVNSVACRPLEPGVPLASIDTVLVPGSTITIGGSGFNAPLVNLYSAGGAHGPLTPLPGGSATQIQVVLPANLPTGPGALLVVNSPYVGNVVSNAVSLPIGATLSISAVSQSGTTVTVDGTGFSSRSVINLFNLQGSAVPNLGGLNPDGSGRIPLTIVSAQRFQFSVPAGAVSGPAYIQVLNPPFTAYASSGGDPDGAFTLAAP